MMSELLLSKEIYKIHHIQEASHQFSSLCKIEISEHKEYYLCAFSSCVYDVAETIKEFENYLIDLMNTGNEG